MLPSRKRLQKIVDGYIRYNIYETEENEYEEMLSRIIIEYLMLKEYFKYCNAEKIRIDENKMKITRLKPGSYKTMSTCYGAIQIPSMDKSVHHWKFIVHGDDKYVAIGIDDTQHLRFDCGLQEGAKSKQYGLWSDGNKSGHFQNSLEKSSLSGYKVGEVVEMILDLKKYIISYRFDGGKENVVFPKVTIGEDIIYSMAVCLFIENDCIELLEYFCE